MTMCRNRRVLRLEALETRMLLSAVSVVAGDMVVPIHAQVGSTALERILGVAAKLDTVEEALDAYLNAIPGWHLTGGIDETPSYSGTVDGSVVLGANGLLKAATMTLTGSADIGATIEGYYGTSVLHVGLGAAADLSANLCATASFSMTTNTWDFGGSASLVGYVKGYATAVAWPLRGEVYVQGDIRAAAAVSSETGIASASLVLSGIVGADAQLKSLFGGWKTIASVSHSLGSWQGVASFDVGAWMQSEAASVVVAHQDAVFEALSAGDAKSATATLALGTTTSAALVATLATNPAPLVAAAASSGGTEVVGTSRATTVSPLWTATASRVGATPASNEGTLSAVAVQAVFATGLEKI